MELSASASNKLIAAFRPPPEAVGRLPAYEFEADRASPAEKAQRG